MNDTKIVIAIRDCNGKRSKLIFYSEQAVYNWAKGDMQEHDEVLYVIQDGATLYSALHDPYTPSLIGSDLTAFFG